MVSVLSVVFGAADGVYILRSNKEDTHLAVWESAQEPPRLDVLDLDDEIPVAAAGRGGHDVLIEREGDEDDDDEEVDHGADGTHRLGTAEWKRDMLAIGHEGCWTTSGVTL